MNFMSKKTTIVFTLTLVLSSFQFMIIAGYSNANPYSESVRSIERDADILIKRGKKQNQQIISQLSCQDLLNRANSKKRNYSRWNQIAQNSTTEYNRRASLASAKGSLDAISQYMSEYRRRC
jgi:hypothetical protein